MEDIAGALMRIAAVLERLEAQGLTIIAVPENVMDVLEEVASHKSASSH